jgi:hypothetical protein
MQGKPSSIKDYTFETQGSTTLVTQVSLILVGVDQIENKN